MLWLELLVDATILSADRLAPLKDEAEELLRITVTSIKRLKQGD